jgi:hypothetical protein
MSGATILGKPTSQLLGDVGCALLQVKNSRGLTLDDMGYHIGVSREMVAQYIAGEAEMGFVKWLRANESINWLPSGRSAQRWPVARSTLRA